MNKKITFLCLLLFSISSTGWGKIEASVTGVTSEGKSGEFELKLKNTFDKSVKSARVWVFMFDDDGKVAGNQSQWLFGGDGNKEDQPLVGEEERSFIVPVQSQKPFSSVQVTLSRIIMEDGSMPDPQASIISAEEPQAD